MAFSSCGPEEISHPVGVQHAPTHADPTSQNQQLGGKLDPSSVKSQDWHEGQGRVTQTPQSLDFQTFQSDPFQETAPLISGVPPLLEQEVELVEPAEPPPRMHAPVEAAPDVKAAGPQDLPPSGSGLPNCH